MIQHLRTIYVLVQVKSLMPQLMVTRQRHRATVCGKEAGMSREYSYYIAALPSLCRSLIHIMVTYAYSIGIFPTPCLILLVPATLNEETSLFHRCSSSESKSSISVLYHICSYAVYVHHTTVLNTYSKCDCFFMIVQICIHRASDTNWNIRSVCM